MRLHTHPCRDCGTPVECDGDLERNYDGWPETICRAYHTPWGEVDEPTCEACQTARDLAYQRDQAEEETEP